MENKLLGIPYLVWAAAALLVSLIWVFFWPSDRVNLPTHGWLETGRYLILRWGHALTWLLLCIAALIAGFPALGGASIAQPVAFASLIVYLIFMGTLLTSPVLK